MDIQEMMKIASKAHRRFDINEQAIDAASAVLSAIRTMNARVQNPHNSPYRREIRIMALNRLVNKYNRLIESAKINI